MGHHVPIIHCLILDYPRYSFFVVLKLLTRLLYILHMWYITYTINIVSLTLDCRKEAWANSFVLTFLMAITWISVYSYMMVWMITVIGATFMIPDTVMGLTFIAAGVSVPDALAGIAVVKEGNILTLFWIESILSNFNFMMVYY